MHCLHEGLWKEAFVREELGQQSSRAWNPHLDGWLLHKMGPRMEKPKTEVGTRVMELTVADGKFPNHIMMLGLCGALNEIHYVAHRAWDSGTVRAKMFPSVSFKFSSLPLLVPWEWGAKTEEHPFPLCPRPSVTRWILRQPNTELQEKAVSRGTVTHGQLVSRASALGHEVIGI